MVLTEISPEASSCEQNNESDISGCPGAEYEDGGLFSGFLRHVLW